MKRIEKTILLAVMISVSTHTGFFALSPHIVLSGMRNFMDEARRTFRIQEVDKRAEKVSFSSGEKQTVSEVKMSRRAVPSGYKFMEKMKVGALSEEDKSFQKKKDQINREKIQEKPLPEIDQTDILKTEEEAARKNAEPEKRSFADKLASESLVSGDQGFLKDENMTHPDMESFYSDLSETDSFYSGAGLTDPGSVIAGAYIAEAEEYSDIGKYIDIFLSKYTDPDTGERFFRLIIKVKDGVRLEVMPKEILFLIDSSKSITEKKLSYFKNGLKKVLTDFNEGDRFNLIVFRSDLTKFKTDSVKYNEKTVAQAINFIDGLEAIGQTDVENALYGIATEPISMYPSYLILMSDGRPTRGIIDSRRIIQEITRENRKGRPIFSFAGGPRINEYLLEFLSYQNRAWSRFALSTFDIEKDFIDLYDQIKDPILVDLRYLIVGLSREEVYPKYLSDFYHGKPLEIYGKYRNEEDFSMQILGRSLDTTNEIIFKKSFHEAEEGGKEIARNWAFRKIYFLISRNTMGTGDPVKLKKEIEFLSERYGIITPYHIKNGE